PDRLSRFDHWYDLWADHHALSEQLKALGNPKSPAGRIEAASLEGRLRSVQASLGWLEEAMAAVLEGEPLPPEPSQRQSVKVADLFGTVIDTHLEEAQLRNSLARQRRRR